MVYVLRAMSAGGSCRRAGLAVSSLAAEPPARPCRRLGGGPCRWAGLADGRVSPCRPPASANQGASRRLSSAAPCRSRLVGAVPAVPRPRLVHALPAKSCSRALAPS